MALWWTLRFAKHEVLIPLNRGAEIRLSHGPCKASLEQGAAFVWHPPGCLEVSGVHGVLHLLYLELVKTGQEHAQESWPCAETTMDHCMERTRNAGGFSAVPSARRCAAGQEARRMAPPLNPGYPAGCSFSPPAVLVPPPPVIVEPPFVEAPWPEDAYELACVESTPEDDADTGLSSSVLDWTAPANLVDHSDIGRRRQCIGTVPTDSCSGKISQGR
ncbi:unnamed protein product [Effrenium voratum]|nr:unnamed protein product [Effrenium voratum]